MSEKGFARVTEHDSGAEAPMNPFHVDQMMDKANWAAREFGMFDHDSVLRIARAAADTGFDKAGHFAERAVAETGFGNADHKKMKNELCSRGMYDYYKDTQFSGYRIDEPRKIVEIAKPAGVIFALTPSTNPVSTVYYKIMCALLTRNAVIVSPHPAAKDCCTAAALHLAQAAEAAGAPEGVIQVLTQPTLPVIEHAMSSSKINVILATGGTAMVRAAYSSGSPAIGVGPGNCPALVDATADVARAAKLITDSKSFDHSVLCTNESAIIVEESVSSRLASELERQGCHVCLDEERDAVEQYLFEGDRFNLAAIGKPASWIAREAGIKVKTSTKVLVVPLARIGDDYPLSGEKLCPVLGLYTVPHAKAGIAACCSMVRRNGGGHSAAIHSANSDTILKFGAAISVLRVVVNDGCSIGASGFTTHLTPTMTVGTGFFGRSSVGENVGPQHLVNWTRVAYPTTATAFPNFEGLSLYDDAVAHQPEQPRQSSLDQGLREQIRKIIIEELRHVART
ncbi:MAG: aldehyde dehydrogenase family protein [Gammaproteobacteria bacterium]|nr:aldehyde dehydrogenase family protein [Gammaproteobacteria bacterium]